jgi:hypothetical protein
VGEIEGGLAVTEAADSASKAAADAATAKALITADASVDPNVPLEAAGLADQASSGAKEAAADSTKAQGDNANKDYPAAVADAKSGQQAEVETHTALTNLIDSLNKEKPSKEKVACEVTGADTNNKPIYTFNRFWVPIWRKGCGQDNGSPAQSYFSVSGVATLGNQAQYIYGTALSTSQINVQLLTATFPGFQAVFAGTVTAQPGTTSAGGTATTQAAQQTNSVSAATASLQQGGDFNLSFPAPLARGVSSHGVFDMRLDPNIGFVVNGLTAQTTSTESTQYVANVPVELYGELGSYDSTNSIANAAFYVDARIGGEFVSGPLASSLGLSSQTFVLAQVSAGIAFQKSVRIGFQYFWGPSGAFTAPGSTTPVTSNLGGVHLVVSYSPSKGN